MCLVLHNNVEHALALNVLRNILTAHLTSVNCSTIPILCSGAYKFGLRSFIAE